MKIGIFLHQFALLWYLIQSFIRFFSGILLTCPNLIAAILKCSLIFLVVWLRVTWNKKLRPGFAADFNLTSVMSRPFLNAWLALIPLYLANCKKVSNISKIKCSLESLLLPNRWKVSKHESNGTIFVYLNYYLHRLSDKKSFYSPFFQLHKIHKIV